MYNAKTTHSYVNKYEAKKCLLIAWYCCSFFITVNCKYLFL